MRDDMKQYGAVGLARLDDLDDYKVAEGDPDVRGWTVKTADGQKAGEVASLIVDTTAMKVRYLDVELDKRELKLKEDRHVFINIGAARLDEKADDVLLSITAAQLVALPPFANQSPTREQEMALRRRLDSAYKPGSTEKTNDTDFYAHPHYDAKQFYGKRGGEGDLQRMTLSEEERPRP